MQDSIAVNEKGYRIGESHHKAKVTNHEVDLILALNAAGFGYKRIAQKFDISVPSVRDIIKGRRRNHTVAGWKVVVIERAIYGNEEETSQ